jgi:dipicolinate synthase subunit A
MRFAVMGGDRRMLMLAGLLAGRDMCACVAGFETYEGALPSPLLTFAAAATAADAVILPLPTAIGGNLNAPYAEKPMTLEELARLIPPDMPIFGGLPGRAFEGHKVFDYAGSEGFLIVNAALTAESAVALAALELPIALLGAKTLVVGFGRIGRTLARLLVAFGCKVSVAARRAGDRAYARTLGCAALDIAGIAQAGPFDAVFNTVPARILEARELDALGAGCLLMELASAPGGFNPDAARARGIRVVQALGLPGKYSPLAAAQAILDAVEELIGKNAED